MSEEELNNRLSEEEVFSYVLNENLTLQQREEIHRRAARSDEVASQIAVVRCLVGDLAEVEAVSANSSDLSRLNPDSDNPSVTQSRTSITRSSQLTVQSVPRGSLNVSSTDPVIDELLAALSERVLDEGIVTQGNLIPAVLPVIRIEPQAPTPQEVFRDSIWNTSRLQTTLLAMFALTTFVLAVLWVFRPDRTGNHNGGDNTRLEFSILPDQVSFRIFGDHDKKFFFRTSDSPDWFDLDPFDPPPSGPRMDRAIQSLSRTIDPQSTRETFLLTLSSKFEGFIELYHEGRQLTVFRLVDANALQASSIEEAKEMMEARLARVTRELAKLEDSLQGSSDASEADGIQQTLQVQRSLHFAYDYGRRRLDESPHLVIWSEVNSE